MKDHVAVIRLDHPVLAQIGKIADNEQLDVYVVGGYVRDFLLSKSDKDLDIVVMGDGVRFARAVAAALGIKTVVSFEKFGTAMVPAVRRDRSSLSARGRSSTTPDRASRM